MPDPGNEESGEPKRCLLVPNPARFFSDSLIGTYAGYNAGRSRPTGDAVLACADG
jgi:hypothetical protein